MSAGYLTPPHKRSKAPPAGLYPHPSAPNNTFPPPPINTTSTVLFLHHDLHPKDGNRFVLPFLTTKDRLQLSERCKGLNHCRYHLSETTTCENHPRLRDRLDTLLLGQQQLECLGVGDFALLSVLESLPLWSWFKVVKTLGLSKLHTWEERGVEPVTRATQGELLKGLQKLKVGFAVVEPVVAALKNGACPELRVLEVKGVMNPNALTEALKSAHLQNLKELSLFNCALRDGATARVLQEGVHGGGGPEAEAVP